MANQLKKLIIPPDQDGYTFNDPVEVLMVQLEGGSSKFRKDILNSNFRVNVQWTLNREEYNYFRTFYNTLISRGADPFLIDLYVDDAYNLTEHKCHFIPGTTGLKSQRGLSFIVGGTIEVYPIVHSLETNVEAQKYEYETQLINSVNLYSYFGDFTDQNNDIIDNLINVQIPSDYP